MKQQVIELGIELEDKQRMVDLLEEKRRLKASQMSQLDEEINRQYQEAFQNEEKNTVVKMEQIGEQVRRLTERKTELLLACRDFVTRFETMEAEFKRNFKELERQFEVKLEQETSKFKQTQEDRLKKFLLQKQNEIIDNAQRSMIPEFNRLDLQEKMELHELEQTYKSKTVDLKSASAMKQQQAISAIKAEFAKRSQDMLATMQRQQEATVNNILAENKLALELLKQECEKQSRQAQEQAVAVQEQQRQRDKEDLAKIHENIKKTIAFEQARQQQEMQDLKKHCSHQIKEFKESVSKLKDRILSKAAAKAASSATTTSGQEGINVTSSMEMFSESLNLFLRKPNDSSLSNHASDNNNNNNNDLVSLTTKLRQERDERLRSVIRDLQRETLVFEKSLQAQHDSLIATVVAVSQREQEQLRLRIANATDTVTELMLQRDQLSQQRNSAQRQLNDSRFRSKDVAASVKELQSEVEELTTCKAKIDQTIQNMENEKQQQQQQQVTKLQEKIQQLQEKIRNTQDDHNNNVKALEQKHVEFLDSLDASVKATLANQQQTINRRKEDIEAETMKIEKYKSLIASYTASPPTAAAATTATATTTTDRKKSSSSSSSSLLKTGSGKTLIESKSKRNNNNNNNNEITLNRTPI